MNQDDRERLDAFKTRLEQLEQKVAERGSVLHGLKEDLDKLRESYHDLSKQMQTVLVMSRELADIPRRMERLEAKVEMIGELPKKFDEFKSSFTTFEKEFIQFKSKVVLVAGLIAPVLTGGVTGIVVFVVTKYFGR